MLAGSSRRLAFVSLLAGAVSVSIGATAAQAQKLPVGFVVEPIGSGWTRPVSVCFVGPGRALVAEKAGAIWYVENDVKVNVVLDLRLETLDLLDRGMLSVAADPGFDQNGHVYVMYAVDPDGDDLHEEKESFCRVSRYTLQLDASSQLVADPATRWDILGADWSSGLPSCYYSHAVGTMRFLSDGSLVLTNGDSAHYDALDVGGLDHDCFGAGKFSSDQDLGSYRSQYAHTLNGKVLRIDPATGLGFADNPWFDGDPASYLSRTYALGLRNPFRFTLMPSDGPRETLVIGDVGWNIWEEVNLCNGGENFGWPCFEGPDLSVYAGADPQSFCDAPSAMTPPLIAWHHSLNGSIGFKGNCVSGLAFYAGTSYPPLYQGALFFADYGRSWIRCARVGADGTLQSLSPFGDSMGRPIDLTIDPATGDLVYISFIGAGEIRRIRYFGSNQPPVAAVAHSALFGPAPLSVDFDAAGSFDPEGEPLAFHWDFGDGAVASSPTVTHAYAGATNATAKLTVTDSEGRTDSKTFLVSPGNTPPTLVKLRHPSDGFVFKSHAPFELDALVADAEDDALGVPLAIAWSADLIHGEHSHPSFATATGASASMTLDSHGPGTYFALTCTATDSRGLSTSKTVSLFDADATPVAHLNGLSDTLIRRGKTIQGNGTVHYPNTAIGWTKPTLVWDWGDGTRDVFPSVGHDEPTTPSHTYAAIGDYTIRLIAKLDGHAHEVSADVEVVAPKPAVAVFTPLINAGFIAWNEQQAIAQSLTATLGAAGVEARSYAFDEQQALVDWMNGYEDDGVRDFLIVLDTIGARVFAGEDDGSLAERWLDLGNAIVWMGFEPFSTYISDGGVVSNVGAGAAGSDDVLDASPGSFICRGSGPMQPTVIGNLDLPALDVFNSSYALRYLRLDDAIWKVWKMWAKDVFGNESDAILIRNTSGGVYAQALCADSTSIPRAQLLLEIFNHYDDVPPIGWRVKH